MIDFISGDGRDLERGENNKCGMAGVTQGCRGGCKSPECFHNGKTFVTAGKMPIFISLETQHTKHLAEGQRKNRF